MACAGEAVVGANVERILERLIDRLMTEPGDALGFGALAVSVGGVTIAIPPTLRGVVVAERVAKQSAAFFHVIGEIGRVVLKRVGDGELDDGGFFESFVDGLVLN